LRSVRAALLRKAMPVLQPQLDPKSPDKSRLKSDPD
jgi:hypothetical protein